jgi:hypothetical protein
MKMSKFEKSRLLEKQLAATNPLARDISKNLFRLMKPSKPTPAASLRKAILKLHPIEANGVWESLQATFKSAIKKAQKALENGDPENAVAALEIALRHPMNADIYSTVYKAKEEASMGSPEIAETLLIMALSKLLWKS